MMKKNFDKWIIRYNNNEGTILKCLDFKAKGTGMYSVTYKNDLTTIYYVWVKGFVDMTSNFEDAIHMYRERVSK